MYSDTGSGWFVGGDEWTDGICAVKYQIGMRIRKVAGRRSEYHR